MDKWEQERLENNKKIATEIKIYNENILKSPPYLTESERRIYDEIINVLKESIKYKLSLSDLELIWQYCQIKIMRDRAWREYNKKPDRYIRIVTGICNDGKTPKVLVKENEHYKTLIDCNKRLECILQDLKLTPKIRTKR